MKHVLTTLAFTAGILAINRSAPALLAAPAYEHAYSNGHLVTISVKDPFIGTVPRAAQNTYYEVIYPTGFSLLTPSIPQCNPCDHVGDGDDMYDYHDHVFAGEPSKPGGGTYGPLWRLNIVEPAYTGNTQHDVQVAFAYAARLPVKSGQAVQDLLAQRLPDGTPVARLIDVEYVFLAAFVNSNAGR
jgi:hypothetical protein